MNKIFSGIQPSGHLHLGNYLGTMKSWNNLQKIYPCIYCIVDLHSITVYQDPALLKKKILQTAACFLACGIQPSYIIIQSANPHHTELAWLLACVARIGWLNRMTQFKEKTGGNKEKASVGLYTYPILMAADILLYQATHVPVGEDQKQHIELARDIILRLNKTYGLCLTLPKIIWSNHTTKVMSLTNGVKKMSKSDTSQYSCIYLTDSADIIKKKIQKAKTDPWPLSSSFESLEGRPEARNLLKIYQALTNVDEQTLFSEFSGKTFQYLKKKLTDLLIAEICPIRTEINILLKNQEYIYQILKENTQYSITQTQFIINNIKQMIGLPCLFK